MKKKIFFFSFSCLDIKGEGILPVGKKNPLFRRSRLMASLSSKNNKQWRECWNRSILWEVWDWCWVLLTGYLIGSKTWDSSVLGKWEVSTWAGHWSCCLHPLGPTMPAVVKLWILIVGQIEFCFLVPLTTHGSRGFEKALSEITLIWLDEQTLEMKLADNTTHEIELIAAKNIPGIDVPCLFSGVLPGDPEAEVAVSGCKGEDLEVSIASEKLLGGLGDLSVEADKTYKIIHTTAREHHPTEDHHAKEEHTLVQGHFLNKRRSRRSADTKFMGRLPQSVMLEISLRYDNSLLARFYNSPTEVKRWISRVVQLAKPRMSLIRPKVHLSVVGTAERYNKIIKADDFWLDKIRISENWGRKGPISYFSAGNNYHSFLQKSHII